MRVYGAVKRALMMLVCIVFMGVTTLFGSPLISSRVDKEDLVNMSTRELIDKYMKNVSILDATDTFYLAGSIIANRYRPSMIMEEKKTCMYAYLDMSKYKFWRQSDYGSGLKLILKAQKIAQDNHFDHPAIPFTIAAIYKNVADETGDKKSY